MTNDPNRDVAKEHVRAALFRRHEPIRIGRFTLLERLGAGAMGDIYAAYDDQLDRKVALKLVRSGFVRKGDERLLREAQTLAQVSHPNVVQIYEAGTYNGRVFIAMELIRGKTLSSWLDDAAQLPRSVRRAETLRHFIAAGRGLEAAHAAGVAHRDFKPDNVLVGDDGRVRVVDFGLARALIDDLVEPPQGEGDLSASAIPRLDHGSTIEHEPARSAPPGTQQLARARSSSAPLKAALRLTETGTVLGTPSYMAPEQMRGAVADLRSDQFSFCVALYHALYDAFPFSGKSLRELQDSMSAEIEPAPSASVPAYLRKALVRGLAVQPSHRFPSMQELLAALEPRRPRWLYAAGLAAGALALAIAAIALRPAASDPCAAADRAIAGVWSPARQAVVHIAFIRSDLPFAEPAWRGVQPQLDAYSARWAGAATEACRATQIAHTQSADQLDRRMLCLDRGRRQIAALVGGLATGAPSAVEHAVEAAAALPDLEACSRPENLVFGVAPPPPTVAAEVAAVRDQLAAGLTLELLGRADEALAIARTASAVTERLGYPPVHAEALALVARAMDRAEAPESRAEVQRLYFEALTTAEGERHDALVHEIWGKLVMLAVRRDASMAQAHAWWDQAHAWWQRTADAAHPTSEGASDEAELHHLRGEIYYRESKYAEAADAERRAIALIARVPAQPLQLPRYEDALAKSLEMLSGLDEALQLHERALAAVSAALGASHPNVVKLEINYGKALQKRGRLVQARAVLAGALASIPARHRDARQDAALIEGSLSDLDYLAGDLDAAAAHARTSLEIYRRAQAPETRLAEAQTNLANVELKRRAFASALALYQDALALRRRYLGDGHYQIGVNELSVAETLLALERPDEAMRHFLECERIFARGSGQDRDTQAWKLTVHGEILLAQRHPDAAARVLEQSMPLFSDGDADPINRAFATWTLARALHELGRDAGRVRELAERARAIFAALGAPSAHDHADVVRFLAALPPGNP
ncbi:MAG TPA: serine/threonine-protein kinase [Kofleriaceae bacterium]|nr:serine/threonine-protein kinase [Kofleriaceae bacterium]